jgi:hypothetical protein
MVSLFLKLSQNIVHNNYSIIFGHSKYSLYSQGKLLRSLYRIMPRCYKKNLSRIYILHPTARLRMCFKISKLFMEDKIADKVFFFRSISQLQAVLSPAALRLPPALIRLEDAALPALPPLPAMASLHDLYVSNNDNKKKKQCIHCLYKLYIYGSVMLHVCCVHLVLIGLY